MVLQLLTDAFVNLRKYYSPDNSVFSESLVVGSIVSAPFMVYKPKNFPGVAEPTLLSKAFSSQGYTLPIRKYRSKRENERVYSSKNSTPLLKSKDSDSSEGGGDC